MIKKTDPRYPAFAAALHDYLHGYFSGIGRKGGLATSAAKSAASRANGAKGGRPRKPCCEDCVAFNKPNCYPPSLRDYLSATLPVKSPAKICSHFVRLTSRAEPASLKQSRIGRCKPASDGSRPSKPKKRS